MNRERNIARPIRVAHVAQQLDTGGMERLLSEFARHSDRALVEPCFVSIGPRGRVADDIEACGWAVATLAEPPGLRPGIIYRLARLLGERQIDVVHTHNTKPLLYAGPAARLAGVRAVVHTRHGRRHGATRRQNFLFRLAARCVDRIVCVSEDSARLCRRDGIDRAIVQTILNGIDLDQFPCSGPSSNGPAVFVGRLTPEKDIPTLLHAARRVVVTQPGFRLVIAGSGPCASELKDLSTRLRIAEVVEFPGEVRDVPKLLRKASMFVLPSITEGLPLTVLEAMASGLPVVATAVGGVPEAVEDGVTGALVPSGEPIALADAVLHVCSDTDKARAMGLSGRLRAETLFDVRRMVSQYEVAYAEILRADGGAVAA
jgi:glycosyltransferase involved in cell wall biosynthesis